MLIYFDICAIPIYIAMLLSIYSKKMIKGRTSFIFLLLIVISFIVTIADLISVLLLSRLPLTENEQYFAYVFSYIYFALRNMSPLLYILFLISITRTWYKIKSIYAKILISIPYAAALIVLFSNPFTNNVFTITIEEGYKRGEGIIYLYITFAIYAFLGAGYIIKCKKLLSFEKWITSMSMYILIFISTYIQFMHPKYLVEMFFMSIALFLVTVFLFKPEEIVDYMIGVLGYKSYQEELHKILITKQSANILIIRFINSNDIRTFLGDKRYNVCIKKVYGILDEMAKINNLSLEIYFEYPGLIYIIADDNAKEYSLKKLFLEFEYKLKEIEALGAKFEAKACLLEIPRNLKRYEEILHFGHVFHRMMQGKEYFTVGHRIVKQKNFQIENNIDTILAKAIKNKSFKMYYQPIFSKKEKKFLSAEALIRLEDDTFGYIPPSIFIPAAEQKGLMPVIGDFVIDSVYRFISKTDFDSLGLDFIEVNLSVAQCIQKDLSQKIDDIRKKYGIETDQISLEITETTYDISGEIIENNMKLLAESGYSFAMDDYGTGYSNIQRIFKLPLKMIKIDKSLVDNIHTKEGMSIMRNTIRMIKDINMEIVVEGVENRETLNKLEHMDLDFIQGFYFSKPLPEEEFIQFMKYNNVFMEA